MIVSRESDVFVSLGANLGDRQASLDRARQEIAALRETSVEACSRQRITKAVGPVEQPDFINQVLRLATSLEPRELMRRLLEIENSMGRVRDVRWGPRTIDIDILFFGRLRLESDLLSLPHPEVWNRPFFLRMVAEIDSTFLAHWDEYTAETDRGK